ncbi:MAG: lamin tail domain-containing protein [Patescibacteria group bacterium]|nr:lamin tail domain-containing protein [Patescibacteria group bacterium]
MKNKGGKIFLILGVLLCSGFFVGQKCSAAQSGDVVINEIAWMGRASSTNDEWVELKNLTGQNINLTGWSIVAEDGSPKINLSGNISANSYFLLERKVSTVAPLPDADLLYDYNCGALSNDGENLTLYGGDTKIDEVNGKKADGSKGWIFGDSGTRQTMERKADGSWCTSQVVGGTPGAANDCAGESPATDESMPAPAETGGNSAPIYRYGDVLINEFVSDPNTGENEWVELYNHSGGEINLEGWTIADGSGAETPLSGGFNENNYYFFVAEKFKGALNNDGDEIILYSDTHNLIDKAVYGKYGEHPENNAPAPGKGQSAALPSDGRKELFDKDSYALTDSPTKGKTNIISAPVAVNINDTATSSGVTASKITITEIFPNPIGSDREGEFIELYNNSAAAVDLAGWRIEIEGGRSFEFGKYFNLTGIVPAYGYFTLKRADSNLVLDNNGGTIKLYAPSKSRAAQSLQYGEAAEGLSYCDTLNLDLKNANGATKTFLNNSLMLNRWVWSEISTPGAANQIKTPNHAPIVSFSTPEKINTGAAVSFDASDSFDEDGDPLTFSWDFGDGGQFNFETPSHIFIKPGNYTIKLAASDGNETATLKKIIKVGGVALAVGGATDENISANNQPLTLPKSSSDKITGEKKVAVKTATKTAESPLANPGQAAGGYSAGVKSSAVAAAEKNAIVKIASAHPINNYKLGASLKLSGQVLVLPGIFGSQYFYILTATNSPAVKIYNYYKNFPTLALGDLISASGVIGGSEADKYLKTKTAADIKIIKSGVLSEPEKITAAGFKEENLGKFVQAEGEVESRTGQQMQLFDGQADINVYFKTNANIDVKNIKAGQKLTAVGLLSGISGGLAIMPRSQADLILATTSDDSAGLVLGAATGSSAWTIPPSKNNSSPLIYTLIAAGGIIIIIAGWLAKKYFSK